MLCFTYVRGPDYKAGLHFSIRAQVGNSSLVWFCVGISGGNLSRLLGSTRVGTWAPTLPRTRSILVSGETVWGPVFVEERIREGEAPPSPIPRARSQKAWSMGNSRLKSGKSTRAPCSMATGGQGRPEGSGCPFTTPTPGLAYAAYSTTQAPPTPSCLLLHIYI